MANENDTLIDVVFRNGVPCKKVKHADGTIEFKPIDETGADSFADVDTKPQPWTPVQTDTLEQKPLTRDQHIDRSCRIEAVLVKFCGPRMKSPGEHIITNHEPMRILLTDLCHALGGEWLETAKRIS